MFSSLALLLLTSNFSVVRSQLLQRSPPSLLDTSPKVVQNILTPDFDRFVEQTLDDWNSAGGLGVAVVQMNEDGSWNVETRGYGTAKGDGSKVTEDTYFSIGSNSKLFDVLAVGMLVSNESMSPQISWNTKIASLIPEWGLEDPIADSQSTILDLMGHLTGLPGYDLMYEANGSLPDLISRTKYLRPSVEFRELFQYNNIMYAVLSHLPEVLVPGVPSYARYVKDNIFVPLGLNQTTFSTEIAASSGKLAQGFARDKVNQTENLFGKGTTRVLPHWNSADEDGSIISGPGGIMMSARDAATWLQTLLLSGKSPVTGETVIPSDVLQTVSTGISVALSNPTWPEMSPVVYGGGLASYSYRGHAIIEHNGGVPGFLTQVSRFPFDNVGVAVFSNDNSYGSQITDVVKWRIVDEIFADSPIDWNTRSKLAVSTLYNQTISASIPRPAEPTNPSAPLISMTGIYNNSAYGTFEFCLVPQSNETDDAVSSSCRELLDELPVQLPDVIDASIPTFVARWNKLWITHMKLEHFDENLFNATGLASTPILNTPIEVPSDNQTHWTQVWNPTGSAEFLIQSDMVVGVAINGLWDAGADVPSPSGNTVEERAEIWFTKQS